jgi:hypothetical protein
MCSREDTKEICSALGAGITKAKHLVHPPDHKRWLPEDLPTTKYFDETKRAVSAVQASIMGLHDVVDPRRKATPAVRATKEMARFLCLTPEFDGCYKRELLVKALTLYAATRGLATPAGFRVDDRLARASGVAIGSVVERKGIFTFAARCVRSLTKEEALALPQEVLDTLDEERRELAGVSYALAELRAAKKHAELAAASPDADLLEREAKRWTARAEELTKDLHTAAQATRYLCEGVDEGGEEIGQPEEVVEEAGETEDVGEDEDQEVEEEPQKPENTFNRSARTASRTVFPLPIGKHK